MHTRYRSLHLSIVGAPSRAVAYNIAKVQSSKIFVALLPVKNFFGMEVWNKIWKKILVWNGIWKKILVWNGIWKKILVWNEIWNGRFLVWKWNGRKLPVWNMEKSSSIPYHALLVAREVRSGGPQALSEIQTILCMSEMSSQYPYILNLYRIYNVLQTRSSLPMGRDQRWIQITLFQKRNDFFNQ